MQSPLNCFMAYGHLESLRDSRMPATITLSYGQSGERADLSELLRYFVLKAGKKDANPVNK